MPNIINIEKFFLKANCCTSNNGDSQPCQKNPPNNRAHEWALNYFKTRFQRKNTLYACTITIGNQKYGSLSAKEQYNDMVKTIKKAYPAKGDYKYIFFFELTKIGQLHAHGITDAYQSRFIEYFNKYGKHNSHDKSYPEMADIGYISYISKEYHPQNVFKPITNVNKLDYNNIIAPQSQQPGGGRPGRACEPPEVPPTPEEGDDGLCPEVTI